MHSPAGELAAKEERAYQDYRFCQRFYAGIGVTNEAAECHERRLYKAWKAILCECWMVARSPQNAES